MEAVPPKRKLQPLRPMTSPEGQQTKSILKNKLLPEQEVQEPVQEPQNLAPEQEVEVSQRPRKVRISPTPGPNVQNVQKRFNPVQNNTFAPFIFQKEIGHGSFGKVYSVLDPATNKIYAVKEFRSPTGRMRELKILKNLRHPNIITIFPQLNIANKNVMFMELIETDLYSVLEDETFTITKKHVQVIMWHLLKGVAFLHSQGILHLDLKPANLLLNVRENTVKIADFGGAKKIGESETCDVITTFQYSPPEEIFAINEKLCRPEEFPHSFATDIWSCGCIFIELFVRQRVFSEPITYNKGVKIECNNNPGCVLIDMTVFGNPVLINYPDRNLIIEYVRTNLKTPDGATKGWSDLAVNMLKWNPNDRISARDALNSLYFKS